MPKAYKRCVRKLMAQGKSERAAHAICTKRNAGNVKAYRKAKRKKKSRSARRDPFLAAQKSAVR